MRQALTSLDVLIPQKAAALAQELEQASLLFEREDQQLARDLRLKALDNEYEQLLRERLANPEFADRRVRVSGKFSQHQIQFTICDEGPGFEPTVVPDPTLPENILKLW